MSVSLEPTVDFDAFYNNLDLIIKSLYNKTEPTSELRKLLIWTGSLNSLSQTISDDEVAELSMKILNGLEIALKKLANINDTLQRKFMTESAF